MEIKGRIKMWESFNNVFHVFEKKTGGNGNQRKNQDKKL